MRLFIAEKPELARAIMEGLGGGEKKHGYYQCAGGDTVTWCFGHMLELWPPEDYDPRLKHWHLADLPFSFVPWKKRPTAKSQEQLGIITALIKRADTIVNAGDPDAEGQLLVDEILQYADYRGGVLRVLINDNTPAVVKKSLANLRDNAEFAGLSAAAEARQVGDFHYGMNMTRLYTLAAKQAGFQGVLSVGRVQTPILGLVVRRDRENAGHQKQNYFALTGNFTVKGLNFPAAYQIAEGDPVDDKGRLNDKSRTDAIAAAVRAQPATVIEASTASRETPPPLPYNLLKLQTDAARLHGLKPDAVKDITQALREKHRLITYNRSDCQYLSEEQHADAPGVIAAVAAVLPDLADGIDLNPALKSRAFDSSKVTAHHAIVPTAASVNFNQLSRDEQKIYTLIARVYLAQFCEPYRYEQTKVVAEANSHRFACQTHVPMYSGWKTIYGADAADDDTPAGDADAVTLSLKDLATGDSGNCTGAEVATKETKPRLLYTMATLLTDLTRVAQYVKDDKLRKLLLDKDKGKAGEHGGIGTPATRDSIIALLFARGFIEERKTGKSANIVSTKAGQDFYDALPDAAKFPDMTAVWHGQQKEIEAGTLDSNAFIAGLIDYLADEVARVKVAGAGVQTDFHPCPTCGKALAKRKGKTGPFWGCTDYPACQTTLPDANGKPGARSIAVTPAGSDAEAPKCPDCGKPMRLRNGKKGAFFGCSGYPNCGKTMPAKDGQPVQPATADPSEIHKCMECGKPLVRRPASKGSGFWWGCSGYPDCKERYFDNNGVPNYGAKKKQTESAPAPAVTVPF